MTVNALARSRISDKVGDGKTLFQLGYFKHLLCFIVLIVMVDD